MTETFPATELMPLEYGLWIGEAWGVRRGARVRLHSIHIRASSKEAARDVALRNLPMFVRDMMFCRVRRATAEDYRPMIAAGFLKKVPA